MNQGTHGGGPRVGGRYELGDLLGRGGMAEVRRGTDIRLGRTVAVKRLRTDLAADPTFQARFRREAQSAAGLNHPNIVSVYDTGEEMAADGSHIQPYIVMEYVPGRTLREVLDDGRKVLPERALELTRDVLAALDYSHRAGIIHRDIKPANVMLTPTGKVKVMDFGIARAIADGTSSMTQTSAVVGTAQYLSPEQARGETVDSRSDVYSTGCLLYELLTGRPPFVGDSPFSVAYQHVREEAPPPSTHNPDVDREIDAIVMKALAKDVGHRYQSAAEMENDIQRYLDGHPVEVRPTDVTAPVIASPGSEATSIFQATRFGDGEEKTKKRWPLVLLWLLLLALLAGAVAVGMQLFAEPEEVAVPKVTNMTQRAAEQRLTSEGLEVSVDRVNSDDVPKGRVIEQDPEAGKMVEPGSTVNLTVSAGSAMVVVQFVIGETEREAREILGALGLNVTAQVVDSDQPKGVVVGTEPNAGESVVAGSTVTILVSAGPAEVPNVVGRPEAAAIRRLEAAGFDVEVNDDTTTPADNGTVLAQSPQGLTDAPRGSTVTITVSRYEEPTPTPTPTEPAPTATPDEPADKADKEEPGPPSGADKEE